MFFVLLFSFDLCGGVINRLSGGSQLELTSAELAQLKKQSEQHASGGYSSDDNIVACFDEMSYFYTGGRYKNKEIKFRLHSPRKIQLGKKYPLIVWFHGAGESDDDNKRQLAHLQLSLETFAGIDRPEFFMLALQCPSDNKNWSQSVSHENNKGDSPMQITREVMNTLIAEFPIDEACITAGGLSGGGSAAWQFVSESPEKFAAIATCSAVPPNKILQGINIWIFVCTHDDSIVIQNARDIINNINRAGGFATLTEIDSKSHDSWTEAFQKNYMLTWLICQKRNSIIAPPPGAVCRPTSMKQKFTYFVLPILLITLRITLLLRNRYKPNSDILNVPQKSV
ncbi:MAG: hypothetical protein LBQ66_15745 [Planctomycetaceae bacterium]|nr:hypothetical protein [Planctomycetaceae bacterium]